MKHLIKTIALTVLFSMPLIFPTHTLAAKPENLSPATPAMEIDQLKLGFFDLYQLNRKQNIANFITEDFWLLSYSLIRQATLERLEQQQIMPLFQTLLKQLQAAVDKQPGDAAGLANREYMAILAVLSGAQGSTLSVRAEQELALIKQAQVIAKSPLWESSMDYSQFKPRGRYTRSEQASRYFQTMRYASSVLFAVQASKATGISPAMAERMTQQALRLTQVLASSKEMAELDILLNWQMGAADDLSISDYQQLTEQQRQSVAAAQMALLDYAKKNHKQPKIIAGSVDISQLQKDLTVQDVMTGWRLMPLRYNADSAVLQRLVYSQTGAYQKQCKTCALPFGYSVINGKGVKGFPSGKELMAILGSATAKQWVSQHGEDHFEGYARAQQDAERLIKQAQGLNRTQLMLLQNWFRQSKSDAQGKQLTAALAYWTWQRYINLLYTKQSYTMNSKSISLDKPRPGAALAPATALYLAIAELVKQHQKYTPAAEWGEFAQLLEQAIVISKKTVKKENLSEAEQAFLNNLDRDLKNISGTDHPIVVDVHSNPATHEVLEEAIGFAQLAQQGKARGARFSHYEFKHPLDDRLTDRAWLKKLM